MFITLDGLTDFEGSAEVAVVLGNTVLPDGQLSERLQKRVEKGLELYQNDRVKKIIVSGGIGEEKQDEAESMKKYLLEKGVPVEAIITDNQGETTWQTARNYAILQKKYHFQSVIVVSQYFHISRSKMIFCRSGALQVHGVHADYWSWRDFYSIFREFFGFYRYLFL
ncbi:MAG: YdcF family protein [Verrucomicrobia bacterium]|nr:YdcF family protein [Cytophagales bacterium]